MGLDSDTVCPDPFGIPDAAHFHLGFKYDSQAGSPVGDGSAYSTPVGKGWAHNYLSTAKVDKETGVDLLLTRGTRTDRYVPAGDGRFSNATGFYNEVFVLSDGSMELHWPNQTVEVYRPGEGALMEIRNRSGQRIRLEYDDLEHLKRVIDARGREILWAYDEASGLLRTITDFTGRTVTLEHDADGNLIAITGPSVTGTPNGNDFPPGKTMRFEYFGGDNPRLKNNLVRVFAPNETAAGGPPKIVVTYETEDAPPDFDRVFYRVQTLKVGGVNASGVPAGGTITYRYEELLADDPDTNTPVFRTTVEDRNGNTTRYELNKLGNIVEMREFTRGLRSGEPPFFSTSYDYNADGEMLEKTLPEGNMHLWAYDTTNPDRAAHGNLLREARLPGPRGGDQSQLVRTMRYEPIYQRLAALTEERGNDSSFVPQNGGAVSAERYTTLWRFDYQEGNNTQALADIRHLPVSFIEAQLVLADVQVRNLGTIGGSMAHADPTADLVLDFNRDGKIDQIDGNYLQKLLSLVILPDGSSQQITEEFQFNDFGQKIAEVDGEGNLNIYEYHPAPTYQATGLGYLFRITRDAALTPKRTEAAAPVAITEEFTYDPVGNWITHRDGRENIDTQDVNPLNQVVRTVTEGPFFYERLYFYDANNNVVERQIQNKDGNNQVASPAFFSHRYKYDILDNHVEADLDAALLVLLPGEPDRLVTKTRYDADENPNLTILPEQNRIARVYDERDLLLQQTHGAGSTDAATNTYNYDGNRNLTEQIDAEDTDGNGAREKWTTRYDGFDRPVEAIDAIGNSTLTTYDPASNAIRIEVFDNPGLMVAKLTVKVYSHDEISRAIERARQIFKDSGGAPQGHVTLTDGPTGDPGFAATQFFYDRNSRTAKVIDDEGDTTLTFYDGVDRPVRRVDAEGNEVLTEYDDNHNPIQITELERQPEGLAADETFVTVLKYDELDRLIEQQDPLKHTRRMKYDSRNNVVFTSDANDGTSPDGVVNNDGNMTVMVYDGDSRLLRTDRHLRLGGVGGAGLDTSNPFNPDGIVSTFQTWDGNSRLTSQTDDNGNTTTYVYNQRDIKIQDIFADRTTNTYVRDLDDNVKTFTDENGSVFTYSYDALNRRLASSFQRASGLVIGTTQQTWSYDGLSRLRGHTDNNDPQDASDDAVYEIVVDSLSRTIEERQNGRLTNSSWFGEDQQVGLTYPGGRQITMTFDNLDRIQSISGSSLLASYNYIGPSRVLRRTYGNGTRLDIGYDADRRITSYQHVDSVSQLLVGFTYTWDREHNRTSEFRLHEEDGDTYEYDSLYRVVSVGFDQPDLTNPNTAKFEGFYTLDGVHNWREFARTKEGETLFDVQNTVNEMNEYMGFANTTEEHDANGNLTKQTIFKENGKIELIRRFFWDALNRLVLVTEQKEGEGPEELIAQYAYYADNRRSLKRVFTSSGEGKPHMEETQFFYDGWRTIEEQDAFGVTQATYVCGPMYLDEHIAMDRRQGNSAVFNRFFYHANSLFSVHGLTNENGELVETVRYDIYGQPFINRDSVDFKKQPIEDQPPKESPEGNPFLFQGMMLEPETGLYWTGGSYYDPQTGRSLQRDPGRFGTGGGVMRVRAHQAMLDGPRQDSDSRPPVIECLKPHFGSGFATTVLSAQLAPVILDMKPRFGTWMGGTRITLSGQPFAAGHLEAGAASRLVVVVPGESGNPSAPLWPSVLPPPVFEACGPGFPLRRGCTLPWAWPWVLPDDDCEVDPGESFPPVEYPGEDPCPRPYRDSYPSSPLVPPVYALKMMPASPPRGIDLGGCTMYRVAVSVREIYRCMPGSPRVLKRSWRYFPSRSQLR